MSADKSRWRYRFTCTHCPYILVNCASHVCTTQEIHIHIVDW
jgi:hypothetical protein